MSMTLITALWGMTFFVFFDWCERPSLNIKVSKTKEMIIDFSGRSLSQVLLFVFKARLLEYKYLGTITDSNLMFDVLRPTGVSAGLSASL